jgi:DNA polymerase
MCKQRITDGVFVYEGFEGKGMTHLPGDTSIRYDGLDVDEEGMFYVAKYRMLNNGKPSIKRQRLYGGILVENNVQALARRILADQILETMERLPRARLAMTTHDEIVLVVPVHSAIKAQQIVTTIMSTPPKWAPDLPLAVQVHLSKRYDK